MPPFDQANWPRGAFPQQFEHGPRGPAPPHGFPFMYFIPPFGYPPPQQPGPGMPMEKGPMKPVDEPKREVPEKENKVMSEDDKKDMERKIAAQKKLAALEERIKMREKNKEPEKADLKHSKSEEKTPLLPDPDSSKRDRHDSEASDSSRRSHGSTKMGKDMPPRFLRQMSGQQSDVPSTPASAAAANDGKEF